MRTIQRYFKLWEILTVHSFISVLSSRLSAAIFLVGKMARFLLFSVFLWALFRKTESIAHYSLTEALFFYLTFNLIDTVTQLVFREVYRFRQLIVTGDFDLVLTKPMNALFRALAGGADPLDLFMLLPYVAALVVVARSLPAVDPVGVVLYIALLINAFVIASAFHIVVLALAILTTEVDHMVMMYRDLTNMGRLPVDIYREPLRSIITFVLPVGVMMTFPAKALMGFLTPGGIVLSLVIGAVSIAVSLRVWRFALGQYASASS
ncbi:ABC-2 family transporter protein [Patescibacteria group bacterium]|nr:ABC-2 family transporter protein [Patescibacteria group bacterium]